MGINLYKKERIELGIESTISVQLSFDFWFFGFSLESYNCLTCVDLVDDHQPILLMSWPLECPCENNNPIQVFL